MKFLILFSLMVFGLGTAAQAHCGACGTSDSSSVAENSSGEKKSCCGSCGGKEKSCDKEKSCCGSCATKETPCDKSSCGDKVCNKAESACGDKVCAEMKCGEKKNCSGGEGMDCADKEGCGKVTTKDAIPMPKLACCPADA